MSLRRLGLLVVAVGLVVQGGAVAQDLDSVEQEVDQLQGDLAEATAVYEDTRARAAEAEHELATLEQRVADLEAQAAELDDALEKRARSAFKQGGTDDLLASLVSADGPQDAVERAGLIQALQSRDRASLEGARNLRTQLRQARELLEDRRDQLEEIEATLAQQRDTLMAELDAAQALAADLRAREARKRRIERGVQAGIYACIFDPSASHFRDTWGDPRSGGRRHEGVDVFAPYDAPVYAFTDGTISRMSSGGLGGISLYIRGDDGNLYFYTHLSGYADTAHVGKRVEAGEHVAYNGSSGNADASAPHVHFELMPGGGGEVNPYPWMAAACF